MKRRAHAERDGFDLEVCGERTRAPDGGGGAGDHDLPRRVEVRRFERLVFTRGVAERPHGVVIASDDGGHSAFAFRHGLRLGDLAALVVPARRTDAVRNEWSRAVRARDEIWRFHFIVMRPAHVASAAGPASLGDCHGSLTPSWRGDGSLWPPTGRG